MFEQYLGNIGVILCQYLTNIFQYIINAISNNYDPFIDIIFDINE